jgi:putative membrane protein
MKKAGVMLLITLVWFAGDVFAHGPEEGYPMGPWMMGWGHGAGWFMPLFMMFFFVAAIVVVIFLIRRFTAAPGSGAREDGTEDPALDILRKRYARGEINREEYEEKKKDLIG